MTNTTIIPALRGVSFNGKSIETVAAAVRFADTQLAKLDGNLRRWDEIEAIRSIYSLADQTDNSAEEALRLAELADSPEYSDIYKDVCGVRPR